MKNLNVASTFAIHWDVKREWGKTYTAATAACINANNYIYIAPYIPTL